MTSFLFSLLMLICICLSCSFDNLQEQQQKLQQNAHEEPSCMEEARASSSKDADEQRLWKWDPSDRHHRCNIQRMSINEVHKIFGPQGLPPMYHAPLVIYDNEKTNKKNDAFRRVTSSTGIIEALGSDFQVTLSSSNSFSAHRNITSLSTYIEHVLTTETTPEMWANETWYLFGETHTPAWRQFFALDTSNTNDAPQYQLPPCLACSSSDLVALSFGIGNRGSGAQWHTHGPGFSETLWGRKHWVLYPPSRRPEYHPDETSRHWMEYTYTTLREHEKPHECTVGPGEMIYFPNEWHHAIINLDRYNSFISTFTQEHLFV